MVISSLGSEISSTFIVSGALGSDSSFSGISSNTSRTAFTVTLATLAAPTAVPLRAFPARPAVLVALTQKETESFKGRYYQGKSYRIEQQEKKVIITHKNRDELLMLATDCRKGREIIKVSQFNLTCEDKNIICDSARDLKQQLERLQKSRQIERGGLSR